MENVKQSYLFAFRADESGAPVRHTFFPEFGEAEGAFEKGCGSDAERGAVAGEASIALASPLEPLPFQVGAVAVGADGRLIVGLFGVGASSGHGGRLLSLAAGAKFAG
jgi:hypothetical protein